MINPYITDGFYVWLYSTDTYVSCDANSEVAVSSLPSPTVTEPAWLKVLVKGIDDPKEQISAVSQKQKYELLVLPLKFPEENDSIEAIYTLMRKRWKYMSIDGDGVSAMKYPYRIHSASKAIALHHEYSIDPSPDYDTGTEELKISVEKRLIIV